MSRRDSGSWSRASTASSPHFSASVARVPVGQDIDVGPSSDYPVTPLSRRQGRVKQAIPPLGGLEVLVLGLLGWRSDAIRSAEVMPSNRGRAMLLLATMAGRRSGHADWLGPVRCPRPRREAPSQLARPGGSPISDRRSTSWQRARGAGDGSGTRPLRVPVTQDCPFRISYQPASWTTGSP